jgi:hypothetical protein
MLPKINPIAPGFLARDRVAKQSPTAYLIESWAQLEMAIGANFLHMQYFSTVNIDHACEEP